jgi:hypothetical protein
MVQLPVFRTYGNALSFTLWNAFTILRLTWLPIACLVAIGMLPLTLDWGTVRKIYGLDGTPGLGDNAFRLHLGLQVGMNLLQALVMTSVAVAIHRVILFNERKPGHYFLFAFGKTEFAFLVMGVLSFLIVIGVMGSLMGPAIYLLAGGDFAAFFDRFKDWPANAPELARTFLPLVGVYLAGWLIVLFIFVRLAVWPPSVVATNSVSPAEAWSLTRGNFWRFIGLFVLATLTMYAIVVPVGVGFYLHHRELMMGREFFEATRGLDVPEQVGAAIRPFVPMLAALYFFLLMYATAFGVALLSYAYKALKGVEAGTAIDGA